MAQVLAGAGSSLMMLSVGAVIVTSPIASGAPTSLTSLEGLGVGTGIGARLRAAAEPAERIKMAASEIAETRRAQSR
jgi:hypothetical protein